MPTETQGGESTSQNDGTGVANGAGSRKIPTKAPGPDPFVQSRDQMLADIDARIVEKRTREEMEFLESADPRAALLHQQMQDEAAGRQTSAERTRSGQQERQEHRAAERQAMDEAIEVADRVTKVDDRGADPLADFVVVRNGRQMFKAVVDGRTVEMPLEEARANIQKNIAADRRLQEAALRRQELDRREAALNKREQTRTAPAPVDTLDLDAEAADLVKVLVSAPEDVAAKRMAQTLKKLRQAHAPIDSNAIVSQAADVAVRTIAANDDVRAKASGFKKFQEVYSDVANDPDLYALADRRSDLIHAEHPDWSPEQIMLEAGKQAREWLEQKTGKKLVVPNQGRTQAEANRNRQETKQQLRPMPVSRTVIPTAAIDDGADDSPQAQLAEIRKGRGQPY
jgi:hypothetical protein